VSFMTIEGRELGYNIPVLPTLILSAYIAKTAEK